MDIMIDFNDKGKREEIHQLLKQGIEEVGEKIKTEVDTRTLEALEKLIGTQEKIIEDYEKRIAMMSKHGLWIPVIDRLPQDDEDVLVWVNGTHRDMAYRDEGVWYDEEHNHLKSITHWMPLPEPPKEGDV